MSEKTTNQNPWRERVAALRNVPMVLTIMWRSSRAAVIWGVILRIIVAICPFAAAKIVQYIINDIADTLRGDRYQRFARSDDAGN